MYLGKLVETGETERVFRDPRHPYTVALLASSPERTKKEDFVLGGNIPSPVSPPSGCPFHTRCFMAKPVCKTETPDLREVGEGRRVACHFAEKSGAVKRALAKKSCILTEKD
jgi:oligopeptide/dipeptide ABC transporter ATP-binding protein